MDKRSFVELIISLGFADRFQQVIGTIVTSEIPSLSNIEYDSVYKADFLGCMKSFCVP